LQTIESFDPQHIVLDSISACRRMGSEDAAFDFLVRLLNHAKAERRTCIYLNQIDSRAQAHQISGMGISSLTDALIVLEQDWHEASHCRRMLIVKLRGSRHSHQWNPFRITDEGLVFGDVEERSASCLAS